MNNRRSKITEQDLINLILKDLNGRSYKYRGKLINGQIMVSILIDPVTTSRETDSETNIQTDLIEYIIDKQLYKKLKEQIERVNNETKT